LLHRICLVLCSVSAAASASGTAFGSGDVVVCLKSEAAVESGIILLKDVADLQGSDPHAIQALSAVPLGPVPEYGTVKILSRHQIGEIVRAAADPFHKETLTGAAAVQIRLKLKPVSADAIASLLRSYLLETFSWKESEIEIPSIGGLQGMELPSADAVLRLAPGGVTLSHRGILAPVEIAHKDRILRCYWITAEVVIHRDVLAAARKIPMGKVIEAGDLIPKRIRITDLKADYLSAPDGIIGKVARRGFLPGEPATREAFSNPVLVKNGETVQLRLERNGIVLTSRGRAEQDGKLGQIIRVRSLDFSTVLRAHVTGRSEVMLN